jgi:GxxExxY protein
LRLSLFFAPLRETFGYIEDCPVTPMTENEIATIVVDAAYKIHNRLGPGLLESVYETTLAYELAKRGLTLRRQQAMPVVYETVQMDIGFRADLIVAGKVIVEIKSIDAIAPVHRKQLLTYLRLTEKRLGAAYQLQC